MKLCAIFPVMNQHEITRCAIELAAKNLSNEEDVEILVLDNGSDKPFVFDELVDIPNVHLRLVRLRENIGVYPIFWEGLIWTDRDILAFFHTDLMISEPGWDKRVVESFKNNPRLGLLGFIGSNEIDSSGGRGAGTISNFQGGLYKRRDVLDYENVWQGSPAEVHGRRGADFSKATIVDGCAMIFKREVLEKIKQREHFPPHHFYDRLLSCEVREIDYEIGVLGIGCDHISGQTVNKETAYHELAKKWAISHNLSLVTTSGNMNWDATLYQEAERQWLTEYRAKHLIPYKV